LVVATLSELIVTSTFGKFQSLAGFLGRCDAFALVLLSPEIFGFNPWRVFLVVATLRESRISRIRPTSFNPWRVFLVVATIARMKKRPNR